MATIIEDAWGGSGNPIGRTPDTVDNGNTWAVDASEDATWNVQSGYVGVNTLGSSEDYKNNLVVDCEDADVVVTARTYIGTTSADGGPLVRSSNEYDGITARINGGTGNLELQVLASGMDAANTDLATPVAVTGFATGSQYDIVLTANGTAISADAYSTGGTLLASISGTSSHNQSSTLHGFHTGRSNSYSVRCYDISISEISLNATVRKNGFDVIVDATSGTVGNYTVKVGPAASESSKTITSALRINATQVRLRLANGSRALATDSVLVSSTADGITDESATNNSEQAANKIVDRGLSLNWTTLNESDVGITLAGRMEYKGSNHPQSASFSAGSGEEQYRYTACMKNPEAGPSAEHPFHEDVAGYNASAAFTLGSALTAGDSLLLAVAYPRLDTHATSTAFSLGDVIQEGSTYYRCTTAGTTAGSKPTFGGEEVTDGAVTWSRDPGANNSAVRRVTCIHYAGSSSFSGQDAFAPAYTSGATRRSYTESDIDTGQLPGDTEVSGQVAADTLVETCRHTWWELGQLDDTTNFGYYPYEQMGTFYGRDLMTRASDIVQTLCSDASYTDELLHLAIQQGLDQIGLREGGGYWRGIEGFTAGRLILPLFAAAVLGDKTTLLPVIREPAAGSDSEDDWRGYEVEQTFFVSTAIHDATIYGGYDWFSGNGGTFANPANAESTYSDGPSGAYFPANVQDSWEHVPEWGGRAGYDPTGQTSSSTAGPRWDAGNPYRQCCSAKAWGVLEYVIYAFGFDDQAGLYPFLDYMRRYRKIEGADTSNYDASYKALADTHLATTAPAYAISSATVDGTTMTLTFNRYTTGTDAGWAAALAVTGGITASSPAQTGPRTWTFTLSGTPAGGSSVTYTASSGDAQDAEGNALGDQNEAFAAPPTVASLSPSSVARGQSGVDITITGTDFVDGADATVSGSGITVNSTTFVSDTELTWNIDLAADATFGYRDVTVTNPDALDDTLSNGLRVLGAGGLPGTDAFPASGSMMMQRVLPRWDRRKRRR